MATFNTEEEWKKCLRALELTKIQWDTTEEKTESLTEDEILQINMSFIEIQYFVDVHLHNIECLVGFYSRWRDLNKLLIKATLKMGFNVTILNGTHLPLFD